MRSVYVGKGLIAGMAADLDRMEKTKKDTEREAFRRELKKQDGIDAQIDGVCCMTEKLVGAALISAVFHLHRGQRRRRRDGQGG